VNRDSILLQASELGEQSRCHVHGIKLLLSGMGLKTDENWLAFAKNDKTRAVKTD
jgi:hypothetical protein